MRAAFGRANIKTEKIQECLHRSGERRSQLNTVPGLTLPANSREYGILEGKEIFLVASNQSCEKWILGRLSKNILGRRKKLCIEKQRKC